MLPDLAGEAVRFIEEQSASEQPFFLYLPVNSPHTPIVPTGEYQESSGAGSYGDFVRQTDAVVGTIMDTLVRCGIAENTLFIMTSDNGAETVVLPLRETYGHHPSGTLKGMKRDAWEGGHRVPFIAWWKSSVPAGSECAQPICLSDFLATCAEMNRLSLPDDSAEDSVSFLPLLRGEPMEGRPAIVHHTSDGSLAIRKGDWKYIDCRGSGGNKYDFPEWQQQDEFPGQLYNMKQDERETINVYARYPDIFRELKELLDKFKEEGRSRP